MHQRYQTILPGFSLLENLLHVSGLLTWNGQPFCRLLLESELQKPDLIVFALDDLSEVLHLLHSFWVFVAELLPVVIGVLLLDSLGPILDGLLWRCWD